MHTAVQIRCFIQLATVVAALSHLIARADCPIDFTLNQVQYGAASGQLGFPINLPHECGTDPISATASAGPLGGTFWQGTGFGDLWQLSSGYTFTFNSGWWGWTPASMGLVFIPDLVISGAGPTVDVRVNVTYGGSASNPNPGAMQNFAWSAELRTTDGNLLGSSLHNVTHSPNEPGLDATTNLLSGIPVGTPFTLTLRAQWVPVGPPGGQTNNGATYLSLRQYPVLALPDGYTLDSELGDIAGNALGGAFIVDGFETK